MSNSRDNLNAQHLLVIDLKDLNTNLTASLNRLGNSHMAYFDMTQFRDTLRSKIDDINNNIKNSSANNAEEKGTLNNDLRKNLVNKNYQIVLEIKNLIDVTCEKNNITKDTNSLKNDGFKEKSQPTFFKKIANIMNNDMSGIKSTLKTIQNTINAYTERYDNPMTLSNEQPRFNR